MPYFNVAVWVVEACGTVHLYDHEYRVANAAIGIATLRERCAKQRRKIAYFEVMNTETRERQTIPA